MENFPVRLVCLFLVMSKVNPTHIVFEEEQEEEQQQGKQLTSAQLAALCPSKTRLVRRYTKDTLQRINLVR